MHLAKQKHDHCRNLLCLPDSFHGSLLTDTLGEYLVLTFVQGGRDWPWRYCVHPDLTVNEFGRPFSPLIAGPPRPKSSALQDAIDLGPNRLRCRGYRNQHLDQRVLSRESHPQERLRALRRQSNSPNAAQVVFDACTKVQHHFALRPGDSGRHGAESLAVGGQQVTNPSPLREVASSCAIFGVSSQISHRVIQDTHRLVARNNYSIGSQLDERNAQTDVRCCPEPVIVVGVVSEDAMAHSIRYVNDAYCNLTGFAGQPADLVLSEGNILDRSLGLDAGSETSSRQTTAKRTQRFQYPCFRMGNSRSRAYQYRRRLKREMEENERMGWKSRWLDRRLIGTASPT
jgi:hypothetical protein